MQIRITVTWMDGKQETYDCPQGYKIELGVLYLNASSRGPNPHIPRRVIPLNNVRIFTE